MGIYYIKYIIFFCQLNSLVVEHSVITLQKGNDMLRKIYFNFATIKLSQYFNKLLIKVKDQYPL